MAIGQKGLNAGSQLGTFIGIYEQRARPRSPAPSSKRAPPMASISSKKTRHAFFDRAICTQTPALMIGGHAYTPHRSPSLLHKTLTRRNCRRPLTACNPSLQSCCGCDSGMHLEELSDHAGALAHILLHQLAADDPDEAGVRAVGHRSRQQRFAGPCRSRRPQDAVHAVADRAQLARHCLARDAVAGLAFPHLPPAIHGMHAAERWRQTCICNEAHCVLRLLPHM